jgi:regulatory protein
VQADPFQKALEAALRYLSPRPRSEKEVRQRLARRQVEKPLVDQVVGWLRERGLLDDVAFAAFWRDNREAFRPRGKRLLEQELRQRGVAPQVIQEQLQDLDEEASALRAAQKKARALAQSDYPTFRAKIGSFLQRRGFSYEVAASATRQLWQEVAQEATQDRSLPPDP